MEVEVSLSDEPVPADPAAGGAVGTPQERRSRAGRNLPAAIGVGVGLGALVLASLFVVKAAFLVVVVIAALIALRELSQALATAGTRMPLVPVAVGGTAMLVAAYVEGLEGLAVAFALTGLAVVAWPLVDQRLADERPGAPGPVGPGSGVVRDVTAGVFAALYVPFLAGFAALLLAADDGARRIVVFIVVTICSDIGGYAAGVLFGKHPMAPTVSPKKSWEGFAGSVLACALAGGLGLPLLLHGQWWQGVLLGLVVVVTATVGDLGESMVKRDLGIKDMGSLLPGHGGLLDRLDSLLPTAPAVFLVLAATVGAN
ncbi:MAG: phosphatidate cytidylyltransferase [Motilibacteraceae bacterium]